MPNERRIQHFLKLNATQSIGDKYQNFSFVCEGYICLTQLVQRNSHTRAVCHANNIRILSSDIITIRFTRSSTMTYLFIATNNNIRCCEIIQLRITFTIHATTVAMLVFYGWDVCDCVCFQ